MSPSQVKQFDDIFYLKEDLIREYAAKRKNLSEQEVKDLFNCLLKFIQFQTEHGDEYAIDIPRIGTLYKPFKKEDPYAPKFDKMMFEIMLNKRTKLNKKPRFEDTDLKELQEWQNEQ